MTRFEIEILSHRDLEAKFNMLADRILEMAVRSTPLQAYVVDVQGDRALLNIGAEQGVTVGRFFDVIEEQLFTKYKGKTLYPNPIGFARLEVVQGENDFCFASSVPSNVTTRLWRIASI